MRWHCTHKFHVLVYRGKGDYHRLGHGSDDHVRRPRQVQGLQGKKVIAIATGSLHCVCCSEDGRWRRVCNLEVCDLRGQGWMHSCKVVGGGYGGIHTIFWKYICAVGLHHLQPLVLIPVNILCFAAEKSEQSRADMAVFIYFFSIVV